MRKISKSLATLGAIVFLLFNSSPSRAFDAVYCTNCSTQLTAALDRITKLDQLATLNNSYSQSLTQTAQQIAMVQNMLKNTMQLPTSQRTGLSSQLTQLANLTGQLNTQRGDVTALRQIYNQAYPNQSTLGNISKSLPPEQANQEYQQHWDDWSHSVDQASQATFQLSGQQLADMQDSAALQDQINQLCSTPEGQMQAMMAGNQLAAIQIQEARELRGLMATSAQSTLAAQVKAEKESEVAEEQWRRATQTTGLDYNINNAPLPR